MSRNTVRDRARKARIRQNEYKRLRHQLEKLEGITDAQIDTLKKLYAAAEKGELMQVSSLPDWSELRAMGVVRDVEGTAVLTSVGVDVLESEAEA